MKIKWYGHAAFYLESNGYSIITDPYTPEAVGYPAIQDKANLVITSSDNDRAHCRSDLIAGNPKKINALELALHQPTTSIEGVEIKAIAAMEAEDHPDHSPEQNAMYRFNLEGMNIAHMGDVGNPLTKKQIDFYQGTDVLLALAGGHPTIALDDLYELIKEVKPKLIIPMHFRTLTLKFAHILWIESFLKYFDEEKIDFAFNYQTEIKKENLPNHTRVLVLDYIRC